jgi:hypothetical protein
MRKFRSREGTGGGRSVTRGKGRFRHRFEGLLYRQVTDAMNKVSEVLDRAADRATGAIKKEWDKMKQKLPNSSDLFAKVFEKRKTYDVRPIKDDDTKGDGTKTDDSKVTYQDDAPKSFADAFAKAVAKIDGGARTDDIKKSADLAAETPKEKAKLKNEYYDCIQIRTLGVYNRAKNGEITWTEAARQVGEVGEQCSKEYQAALEALKKK